MRRVCPACNCQTLPYLKKESTGTRCDNPNCRMIIKPDGTIEGLDSEFEFKPNLDPNKRIVRKEGK